MEKQSRISSRSSNLFSPQQVSFLGTLAAVAVIMFFWFLGTAHALDVTLSWDANTGDIAAYRVYYDTDSGVPYEGSTQEHSSPITVNVVDLEDPNNPQYVVVGLANDSAYYFAITAVDSQGQESGYSNEVSTVLIESFTATPSSIDEGGSSTLAWTLSNANSASIDNGIGQVDPDSGTRVVSPVTTTTYTLTALNDSGGSVSSSVTVTVNEVSYQRPVGGYSSDNVIPANQVSQSTSGDGVLTINFKIKDAESDSCILHTFQYSTNGGNTWNTPTNGDNSNCLSSGWEDNNGARYSSATDFAGAEIHTFTFNTRHQDVSGLAGTEQSDIRIRFVPNDSLNDSLLPVTSESFGIDNLSPVLSNMTCDDDPSHVDVGVLTLTASFGEALRTAPTITIDRPSPMSTIGPVSMSGSGSVWSYEIAIGQHNETTVIDGINTITVSNATDAAGNTMSADSSNMFITDTEDTDGDDIRDYEDADDDNDGLPDVWETAYGLDPLNSDGVNGRDGDPDGDGWSNYEEFANSTEPNNENSFPEASPPQVLQTIPHDGAGIGEDSTRISNNASICVLIEDQEGIDITDPNSILFRISDGLTGQYSRNLGDPCVRVVKLTEDADEEVSRLWVVYDRASESEIDIYAFDAVVRAEIEVYDRRSAFIDPPLSLEFGVESESEHMEANDPNNLPETQDVSPDDPDLDDSLYAYDSGVEVISGDLRGAKIIFGSGMPVEPTFGPTNEIPPLDVSGAYQPMNLEPPSVFDPPVKIFIPYPNHEDVSDLNIFLFNGTEWVLACDSAGNVQPGGEGWMIPGSRVNHNSGNPSAIEIKVYHFSAVQAGYAPQYVDSPDAVNETGGKSGCFIATAAYGSLFEKHVRILRQFRDVYLLKNGLGRAFVNSYYRHSPPVADFIAKHEGMRFAVRCYLAPIVGMSYVALHTSPLEKALLCLLIFSLLAEGFIIIRRWKGPRQANRELVNESSGG
ncbi:MAG: fibronectin type III domain-containing protein [Thermodesulfobacteriota bacterium]|nr:fibronectin type III domain-containing protein [Thermodesulfobacteriota bacterium]